MQHYFDDLMPRSYANGKVEQICSLIPFFHESPEQPVHYYAAHDPYWTLSQEAGHQLAVIDVPMEAFSDIDHFEHQFVDVVTSRFLDTVEFPPHRTLLLTENIRSGQGMDKAHALDSAQAKTWVKTKADEMRAQFNQAMQEDPDGDQGDVLSNVLFDGDVRVRVVLVFEDKPDYIKLNGLMKQVSGQVDGRCLLSVPYVGFSQGYDGGSYDTGNAPVLLTSAELESEEDNYDEEYEDDE